MTREEFFKGNPDKTFADYKIYLEVVIKLSEQLDRCPTEEDVYLAFKKIKDFFDLKKL